MKTLEGGYGIVFESKEEEKEFYEACRRQSLQLVNAIGSIILILAEDNLNKKENKNNGQSDNHTSYSNKV